MFQLCLVSSATLVYKWQLNLYGLCGRTPILILFFLISADNFRPYLSSFQSNDSTDYINAVFVDVRNNVFIFCLSSALFAILQLFYENLLIFLPHFLATSIPSVTHKTSRFANMFLLQLPLACTRKETFNLFTVLGLHEIKGVHRDRVADSTYRA